MTGFKRFREPEEGEAQREEAEEDDEESDGVEEEEARAMGR